MSFLNFSKKIIKSKKPSQNKPLYLLSPFAESSLVTGNFKNIVTLPPHLKDFENEWIAVNTFDFFTHLSALFGSISEFCTPSNCPVMMGPTNIEYQWIDSQKRSIKVSAPQYIDFMMTQIQNQLNDETIFPTKQGMDFPKDFLNIVRGIFKHFIRLFAHVYHAHYEKLLHLEMEAHWNTLLSHVFIFGKEFDLLQDVGKKEMSGLQDLFDVLKIE